jgi:hypothetical protein
MMVIGTLGYANAAPIPVAAMTPPAATTMRCPNLSTNRSPNVRPTNWHPTTAMKPKGAIAAGAARTSRKYKVDQDIPASSINAPATDSPTKAASASPRRYGWRPPADWFASDGLS